MIDSPIPAEEISPWLQALFLALGTLLSEDLSAISGGILASTSPDNLPIILFGCWAGMWVGDMVYYIVGYTIGKPALLLPFFKKIISETRFEKATQWFEKRGLPVLAITRLLPGTRPATFLAAGVLRFKPIRFIVISLILTFLWALILILLSMRIGHQLLDWAEHLHLGIFGPILSILLILLLLLGLTNLSSKHWRRRSPE